MHILEVVQSLMNTLQLEIQCPWNVQSYVMIRRPRKESMLVIKEKKGSGKKIKQGLGNVMNVQK
eukprot:c21486_g1_i1 orf=2-190(-)